MKQIIFIIALMLLLGCGSGGGETDSGSGCGTTPPDEPAPPSPPPEETCPDTEWPLLYDLSECEAVDGGPVIDFFYIPDTEPQQALSAESYSCIGDRRFQIIWYSEYIEEQGEYGEKIVYETIEMRIYGDIDTAFAGTITEVSLEDGTDQMIPASGDILTCEDRLAITDLVVDGQPYPDMTGIQWESLCWTIIDGIYYYEFCVDNQQA